MVNVDYNNTETDSPKVDPTEALLFRIQKKDREALGKLYEQMRVRVYSLALSYLGNAEDAQDVTQDTFVQVWLHADQYRHGGSASGWVFMIAKNQALMKRRKQKYIQDIDESEWNAIPAKADAVSAEDRDLLQKGLAGISARDRQIILLHAVNEWKHKEIAEFLKLPLGTVLSAYKRSLRQLKIHMEREQ